MTKQYGYFVYDGEAYVIRFKLGGNIIWDPEWRCYIDDKWYTRGIADMIALAAFNTNRNNIDHFGCAFKITHEGFKQLRSNGVRRWMPYREIIIW